MNYDVVALWSQVVAAILFAAIVVWGFHKFITPAINAATAAKNEEIRVLERRRDDARKAVVLMQAERAAAEADAVRIRERIERDAWHEVAAIEAEGSREAARIVRNASGELSRARLAAHDKLRVEMIEKALDLARRQAMSRINAAENQALVRRFINELEGGSRG